MEVPYRLSTALNRVPVVQAPRAVRGEVVGVNLVRSAVRVLRVAVVEGAVLLGKEDELVKRVVEVVEEQLQEAF